ncbi:hypothetical protein RvY_09554 [Ramazzottius varieornatus]|uniref:Tetraspanin n=1 Tax=Ramazzottius varieornatus TaxID=947166 RepID=A0A1D1VEA3_RAMVA|nr:hypothetical protein RvY_09554 [Ramazzottius varieornatus]
MAIGIGAKLARLLLLAFNSIFWLSGIGLIIVGVWLFVDQSKAMVFAIVEGGGTLPMIKIGAWAVIGIGCFVVLVGFLGCCGAMQENRCMLVTYFAVILLILLAELVTGILMVIYKNQLEQSLQENMQMNLQTNYGGGTEGQRAVTNGFDFAQYTFRCCGVKGSVDYNASSWSANQPADARLQVPLSCCRAERISFDNIQPDNREKCMSGDEMVWTGFRYGNGCYDQVKTYIGSANGILIGVGVGIAALELLGMIFAICLCRNIDYDI